MFLSRIKKNNVHLCNSQLYYIKVGYKEVKIIYMYVFVMSRVIFVTAHFYAKTCKGIYAHCIRHCTVYNIDLGISWLKCACRQSKSDMCVRSFPAPFATQSEDPM